MIQTEHLQYRYVQRVLGISGQDNIRKYLNENYYKVYHDIDMLFKGSRRITTNWSRFKNNDRFDLYIAEGNYIFYIDSVTKMGNTIVATNYDGSKKKLVSEILTIEHEINIIEKAKSRIDQEKSGLKWALSNINEYLSDSADLEIRLAKAVEQGVHHVGEIRQLKEQKKVLIEVLLKRKDKVMQ